MKNEDLISLKGILAAVSNGVKQKVIAHQKSSIAKAFNDFYTYCNIYDKRMPELGKDLYTVPGGNAWMCPECNVIHYAYKYDPITGVHFPGCCSTPSGHRLYHGIKTS